MEINQLEMVAYIIVTSKKVLEFKEKDLTNYLKLLNSELTATDKKQILNMVDLRIFNEFQFRQVLNTKEIENYAKLIFKRLLNYYHKEFNDKDIIKEAKFVFYSFSPRTASEEVSKLER